MPPTHKPTSHRLKATQQPDFADLAPSKQELHILRRQLLHSHLVIVDRAINHVGLLLLQHHHSALDRILDTKTSDDARAFLPDAVAAVGGLPFCGGIPPSVEVVKSVIARVCRRRRGFFMGNLRVNDKDSRGFGKVKRHTARLERDEEDFDVCVVHEILNRPLTL